MSLPVQKLPKSGLQQLTERALALYADNYFKTSLDTAKNKATSLLDVKQYCKDPQVFFFFSNNNLWFPISLKVNEEDSNLTCNLDSFKKHAKPSRFRQDKSYTNKVVQIIYFH